MAELRPSLLVTAASQHTGIPYRRKALLDAGRVLLGACAAVTRFGSPCMKIAFLGHG